MDFWSGVVVARPDAEPITMVSAGWKVPQVYPLMKPNGDLIDADYRMSAWIGMDSLGTKLGGPADLSVDLLRAGTDSRVTVVNGKVAEKKYLAWYEWGPPINTAAKVYFDVGEGDSINCSASLMNGPTVSFSVNDQPILERAPFIVEQLNMFDGPEFVGVCAEWIVERWDPNVFIGTKFSPYTPVIFTGADANTKNISRPCMLGNEIDMLAGLVFSSGRIIGKDTLICHYVSRPIRG